MMKKHYTTHQSWSAWVANLLPCLCQILAERYIPLFCFWNMLKHLQFFPHFIIHSHPNRIALKFNHLHLQIIQSQPRKPLLFLYMYYILSVFVTYQDVWSRFKNWQNTRWNCPIGRSVTFNIIMKFTTPSVFHWKKTLKCVNSGHV